MSIALFSRRDQIPSGALLVNCAVSGGTLEAFLRAALELSAGKLCVVLSPVAEEFPLPCPTGAGRFLSQEALARLPAGGRVHFSEVLGTNYRTLTRDGQVFCVLFDTTASLRYRLRLAQRLGVPWALIPDPSLFSQLRK